MVIYLVDIKEVYVCFAVNICEFSFVCKKYKIFHNCIICVVQSKVFNHIQSGAIITWFITYIMIFYTVLQWLMQNIKQGLYSQKTPHTSPSWVSYGVSIVRIWRKLTTF